MPSILNQQLAELENHRPFPTLDCGPGSIYPYYDGYSLVNLPASICRWLDAPELGMPPLKTELTAPFSRSFQHVILLVVDGMGLDRFLSIVQPEGQHGSGSPVWQRLLPQGHLGALTSITPSTTSAALTSLWTGRAAAAHGIMGYEIWLKEYALVANMITHSAAAYHGDGGGLRRAGFQPETFLPVKSLGTHLTDHAVKIHAFMPGAIARSGLSTMQMPGVAVSSYFTYGELWVSLTEHMRRLRSASDARSYTYVYWGDIDNLSHRFGPEDQRVQLDFENFSLLLENFITSVNRDAPGDILLLVTADHGHITTYPNPAYEMRNHPELLSHLVILPTGENRLPYLYLKPGHEDALRAYVDQTWPEQFRLFPAHQVIESGLFGPGEVYPPVYDRVGDLVVVPQGNAYWWFANRDNPLIGRHGGLSRDEMLVPFFAVVI
jgi:hypothetical protein